MNMRRKYRYETVAVRNHCENETPEPLLGPVCFRGGSDGWEFHGQRGEGGGRWDENSSKYCLIKARNDADPNGPEERGPVSAKVGLQFQHSS
jgi:hypothetical protein